MSAAETAGRLERCGVVAVVRMDDSSQVLPLADALCGGGIDVVEITMTVPDPIGCLRTLVRERGDRIVVGAGTVLDAVTAREAVLAGARFVVSPIFDPDLVRMCRRYGVFVAPGALTPTEVVKAWSSGADAVKIFPAEIGGPRYLKALRGPLPQVRLFPTGGVTTETVAQFFDAGAWCLGAGSALVSKDALARSDWATIEATARRFRAAVDEYRRSRSATA